MQQVLDTLSDSTSSTMANDLDLIFLKGIMESPVVRIYLSLQSTYFSMDLFHYVGLVVIRL